MPDDRKTYLLELTGGRQRRITIPASWKVTFGPMVAGIRKDNSSAGQACFRLYETKEKQRACFTDVNSFRELGDIEIEEKVVQKKRQHLGKEGPKGFKNAIAEVKIEKWIDPDAPEDDDETEADYLLLKEASPEVEDF
jgi:hypothetical protein